MNKISHLKRDEQSDSGFTLVELLVVLAIIGLLAALAAPQVLKYLGQARVSTTQAQLKNIGSALELYYLDTGTYPGPEDGLEVLVSPKNGSTVWNGPYLKGSTALIDGWGNKFVYVHTDAPTSTIIKSLGRDGKLNGSNLDQDIELKVQ